MLLSYKEPNKGEETFRGSPTHPNSNSFSWEAQPFMNWCSQGARDQLVEPARMERDGKTASFQAIDQDG